MRIKKSAMLLLICCVGIASCKSQNMEDEQRDDAILSSTGETIENPADFDMEGRNPDRLNTDRGYKIFYGTWLVGEVIGRNHRLDDEDVSDIIGTEVEFYDWKSSFSYLGAKVEILYPEYEITMIPLDNRTSYLQYMPSLVDMGVTGGYATIICVSGNGRGYNLYFIMKDDDSMIIFYKEAFLELTRITHKDGAEYFYEPL